MIILILLFLISPFSPNSFAGVTFAPYEQKQYLPGDFVKGTLSFETKMEGQVIQLKGKKFLGNLYVSDVAISGVGKADITLIPLGPIDSQKTPNWEGVQVDLSALVIGQSAVQPKAFLILKQYLANTFFEDYGTWLIIFFILSLIGFILWKIRKNKMFLKALLMGKEKKKAFWRKLITEAAKREDFEMIYNKRKDWMPLLELNNLKIGNFFETLNRHQYKKNWSEADFLEVQDSYIRFKNGI